MKQTVDKVLSLWRNADNVLVQILKTVIVVNFNKMSFGVTRKKCVCKWTEKFIKEESILGYYLVHH